MSAPVRHSGGSLGEHWFTAVDLPPTDQAAVIERTFALVRSALGVPDGAIHPALADPVFAAELAVHGHTPKPAGIFVVDQTLIIRACGGLRAGLAAALLEAAGEVGYHYDDAARRLVP